VRVLIVAGGYPSSKYYMNRLFEFDQARALAANGHQVILAAIDLRSIRRWRHWIFESLQNDNVCIEAFNFPLGPLPTWILQPIGKFGLRSLYKKCERKYGKPDIIHAHFTDIASITVKALSSTHIPIVMTEHSSGINSENIENFLFKMAQFTYHNVSQIIAVSPALRYKIEQSFNVKAQYIPNILDLEVFKYNREPMQSENFVVVSVGNLLPIKRMDILIGGFAKFAALHPNCKLMIIGGGPEESSLAKLIVSQGMEEKIHLSGPCRREEIATILRSASCFALVSSSETFGVAYIEALSCGVPVIATRCGGPEAFVHSGNGILIPVNDEDALVEAMKTMYVNYQKYDRKKIAEEIVQKFSPKAVANQLEVLYQRVIND